MLCHTEVDLLGLDPLPLLLVLLPPRGGAVLKRVRHQYLEAGGPELGFSSMLVAQGV